MNDYISRQAAIEEIRNDPMGGLNYKRILTDIPAADVVPAVHGKWIPQDHNKRIGCATTAVFYYPKCSACGHNGNYDMYYCPNCGADMRGEQDE